LVKVRELLDGGESPLLGEVRKHSMAASHHCSGGEEALLDGGKSPSVKVRKYRPASHHIR